MRGGQERILLTIPITSDMPSWTRCIANRQCFAHVRRFVVFVLEEILLTTTTTSTVVDYTLLLEVIWLPGHAALLTVNVLHTYGALWSFCLKKYCLLLFLLLLL